MTRVLTLAREEKFKAEHNQLVQLIEKGTSKLKIHKHFKDQGMTGPTATELLRRHGLWPQPNKLSTKQPGATIIG